MKTYIYGLVLGAMLLITIVLSNLVFPDNSVDSAPLMLIPASVIGIYVVWAAHHGSHGDKRQAIKIGAITSAIGFVISMLTFVVIDNAFLSIVSQQSDKVIGFRLSSYTSMRDFINAGLMRGILLGTPAALIFGIICGWLAATIIPKLRLART